MVLASLARLLAADIYICSSTTTSLFLSIPCQQNQIIWQSDDDIPSSRLEL